MTIARHVCTSLIPKQSSAHILASQLALLSKTFCPFLDASDAVGPAGPICEQRTKSSRWEGSQRSHDTHMRTLVSNMRLKGKGGPRSLPVKGALMLNSAEVGHVVSLIVTC